MASSYRVVRGFGCPDPRSLKIVRKAGGMSKLSDEQRADVNILEYAVGDPYKGAPKDLREGHIAKGLVELVPDAPAKKAQKKGGK